MADTAKAYSSYMTYLMVDKTGNGSYTKLVDIKSYSDLGDTPEILKATTLSDGREWGVKDIIKLGNPITFKINYTPESFKTVEELKGKQSKFALWFGGTENSDGTTTPKGDRGVFVFEGEASIRKLSEEVSDVKEAEISIIPLVGPDFYENAEAVKAQAV